MEAEMSVKFKDLLDKFTDQEILVRLFELYPDQKQSEQGYIGALEEIRHKRAKKTTTQLRLSTVPVDEFNDEEYVDVSGFDPSEPETSFAIEYNLWSEWLGMELHPDTLQFPELDVVARSLWEMTWSGYSQQSIRGRLKKLLNIRDEAMKDILAKEEGSGKIEAQ